MVKGVGICTYNRANHLGAVIEGILNTTLDTKIVVADDGSTDETAQVVAHYKDVIYVRGPNKGVAYNKNRVLFALQNCDFISIIEDDLVAVEPGWFEIYQEVAELTGIHHFCRVQDKEVPEKVPSFTEWLQKEKGLTPIYGESPRGDFTFITRAVLNTVGAFNFKFVGVGYAHGEWSNRIANAGLISHPQKWIDIKEARDKFVQRGDTEGGRWQRPQAEIKQELKVNRAIQKELKASRYVFEELDLL